MARPPAGRGGPGRAVVLGLVAVAVVAVVHLAQGRAGVGLGDLVRFVTGDAGPRVRDVLVGTRLPRTVAGLVVGGALGAAGVLLQSATRNALAEPSTLGVNAGANLAVVVVSVAGWQLEGLPRGGTALLGAVAAAVVVLGVSAGTGASPTRMVLAGVAVSLACSSVAAALLIIYEQDASGLFLWGHGALPQTGYGAAAAMGPVVAVLLGVAVLVAPRLDVLALGDATASGLGVRPGPTRLTAAALGVTLTAAAVTVVGPIGFVGLAAPHAVRLLGTVHHRRLLPAAALWGAALVLSADVVAQWLRSGPSGTELPAGVVTALLGGPLLVLLARRTPAGGAPPPAALRSRRRPPYLAVVAAGGVGLAALSLVALSRGDLALGLGEVVQALTGGGDPVVRRVVVESRLPRLGVAALAGAALGVAGAALQATTRNPLSDPALLGVTGGAATGALGLLFLVSDPPAVLVPVAAFAGAVAVLAVVLAASWRDGLQPERLVLVGVAAAAFTAAVVDALVVHHGLRLAQALVWLSGSTYAQTADDVRTLVPWAVVLVPVVWLAGRHVDVLALGDDAARGLGVGLGRTRLVALMGGCLLAAATVAVVGTVGFVGLLAPHLARPLVGARQRRLVPAVALLGAAMVVAADVVGRTAFAPREIPSGLVVSALGAPLFLHMLWRTREEG